jgi:ribosomal protein S9
LKKDINITKALNEYKEKLTAKMREKGVDLTSNSKKKAKDAKKEKSPRDKKES